MIGEEVDDGRLRFEGCDELAPVLLAFFGYEGGSRVGQDSRAVRARPVAQEELEGRDVLVQQRHLAGVLPFLSSRSIAASASSRKRTTSILPS